MLACVFILLQYLFDCLVGPRKRADALRAVRRRLASRERSEVVSPEESVSALRLRVLRESLGARLGTVGACTDCVRPRSLDWPGGYCCSGRTEALFTDDELASLKLAGTTSRHLRSPHLGRADRANHTGCVFRGPCGCALPPSHRPSLCVRYACFDLQRELDQREDREETNRLQAAIDREFDRFVKQRRTRRQEASFDALRAAIGDMSSDARFVSELDGTPDFKKRRHDS